MMMLDDWNLMKMRDKILISRRNDFWHSLWHPLFTVQHICCHISTLAWCWSSYCQSGKTVSCWQQGTVIPLIKYIKAQSFSFLAHLEHVEYVNVFVTSVTLNCNLSSFYLFVQHKTCITTTLFAVLISCDVKIWITNAFRL